MSDFQYLLTLQQSYQLTANEAMLFFALKEANEGGKHLFVMANLQEWCIGLSKMTIFRILDNLADKGLLKCKQVSHGLYDIVVNRSTSQNETDISKCDGNLKMLRPSQNVTEISKCDAKISIKKENEKERSKEKGKEKETNSLVGGGGSNAYMHAQEVDADNNAPHTASLTTTSSLSLNNSREFTATPNRQVRPMRALLEIGEEEVRTATIPTCRNSFRRATSDASSPETRNLNPETFSTWWEMYNMPAYASQQKQCREFWLTLTTEQQQHVMQHTRAYIAERKQKNAQQKQPFFYLCKDQLWRNDLSTVQKPLKIYNDQEAYEASKKGIKLWICKVGNKYQMVTPEDARAHNLPKLRDYAT